MAEFHYLAFYKPYGVMSTFTDDAGRAVLKDYISIPGVYAAGRLDFDSEGLLLLSDNGTWIHRLTDPIHKIKKTYLVQVEGIPTPEALGKLAHGVEIHGYQTRPCQVMEIPEPELPARSKPVTPHGPTRWLRIVLSEGKKRQIRHSTAVVGLLTLRIVRIAIGSITLLDLKPGELKLLAEKDAWSIVPESKRR